MTKTLSATFIGKRLQDSGKDQAPDFYVYEFNCIYDNSGKNYKDKWIKETKLLQAVDFKKGKQYQIILSNSFQMDSKNLPYPVEISWDGGKVYLKNGNSIIHVDHSGIENNLSISLNKSLSLDNKEIDAQNKFAKGILTKDLLLEMNSRGIFYFVHNCDPQDKRKSGGCSIGWTKKDGNHILIKKETQEEIDRDLISIKRQYVTKEIENNFEIKTELLHPKRKK
jgi:hypothetical protein